MAVGNGDVAENQGGRICSSLNGVDRNFASLESRCTRSVAEETRANQDGEQFEKTEHRWVRHPEVTAGSCGETRETHLQQGRG